MILRNVSSARWRCLPQKKHDIVVEPRLIPTENGEPAVLDLYRKPSATIWVWEGFDIALFLLFALLPRLEEGLSQRHACLPGLNVIAEGVQT